MILIVTSKTDYTADFLILEFLKLGVSFIRFNTEDFPQDVDLSVEIDNSGIAGQLTIHNRVLHLEEISSIWYRRPSASSPPGEIKDTAARDFIIVESRETLEGLWRILPCFWVSHPDNLRVAESKLYQLTIASRMGFVIPQTLVTTAPEVANSFHHNNTSPLIYKPLRRGQIIHEGNTGLIYTNLVKLEHLEHMDNVRLAPSLFQPYVPKLYELRVTVVGNRVFAVELHSQEVDNAINDWRRVNPEELRHVPHELNEDIKQKCIALVQSLGLAFGAIDLIYTPEGEHVFLEINPNGQWAWIEQMCPEIRISEAMVDLLATGGNLK